MLILFEFYLSKKLEAFNSVFCIDFHLSRPVFLNSQTPLFRFLCWYFSSCNYEKKTTCPQFPFSSWVLLQSYHNLKFSSPTSVFFIDIIWVVPFKNIRIPYFRFLHWFYLSCLLKLVAPISGSFYWLYLNLSVESYYYYFFISILFDLICELPRLWFYSFYFAAVVFFFYFQDVFFHFYFTLNLYILILSSLFFFLYYYHYFSYFDLFFIDSIWVSPSKFWQPTPRTRFLSPPESRK